MGAPSRTLLLFALVITRAICDGIVCKNGSLIGSTGKCCYGIAADTYCCVKDLATASCIGLCSPDGSDCLAKVDYDDPKFDEKVQDALKNSASSSSGTSSSGSTPTAESATPTASESSSSTGSDTTEPTSAFNSGSTVDGVSLIGAVACLAIVPALMDAF